jgi:hypothetical protein
VAVFGVPGAGSGQPLFPVGFVVVPDHAEFVEVGDPPLAQLALASV